MRRMAKDLNAYEAIVIRVVKKEYWCKVIGQNQKVFSYYYLKVVRVEHFKKLFHMLKKKLPILLFSDEKFFILDPKTN